MSWVILLFMLPLVLFALFLPRVIRVGRQLRDPEQLRALLSDEVRAALREAGVDPDSVSMQEIQRSEELQRLVAADLRRVLRSAVLGLPLPQSGVCRDTSQLRSSRDAAPAMQRWRARPSGRTGQPYLPAPIDQSSGPGVRIALVVAVIVGLITIAFVVGFHR